jgi:hypothetical protein
MTTGVGECGDGETVEGTVDEERERNRFRFLFAKARESAIFKIGIFWFIFE